MATGRVRTGVALLRDVAVVATGGLTGVAFASQLDTIENWVTKWVKSGRKAIDQADELIARWGEMVSKQDAVLEKARRHDNLSLYRYVEVDALEGLFVAEEYNPESIRMAAEQEGRRSSKASAPSP